MTPLQTGTRGYRTTKTPARAKQWAQGGPRVVPGGRIMQQEAYEPYIVSVKNGQKTSKSAKNPKMRYIIHLLPCPF
jgi:hypothetical protein